MPKPKPIAFKKRIEKIVKEKRKIGDNNPAVFLKVPKSKMERMHEVSKEVNRFKSKTDFLEIDKINQKIKEDAKKRFGNSTLVQIKDNLRDPLAKDIPNSLPRRSSLMGIINAYKKNGLTNFAIAVTDIKTGKVMGYTVIRLSKMAQELINTQFKKIDFDSKSGEQSFRSLSEKIIPTGENAEIRYEEHLREFLGFQIKHLTMPGYTIDPQTRDFRQKTIRERLSLKK
jgi:hypothetical protein